MTSGGVLVQDHVLEVEGETSLREGMRKSGGGRERRERLVGKWRGGRRVIKNERKKERERKRESEPTIGWPENSVLLNSFKLTALIADVFIPMLFYFKSTVLSQIHPNGHSYLQTAL